MQETIRTLMIRAVGACFMVAGAGPVQATTADFQDGTIQGWSQGAFGGTSAVADAGPDGAGDFALAAMPNPALLHLHPATRTTPEFVGDLLGAGIAALVFDAMAPASNVDTIQLHAVVIGTSANRWASIERVMVPNDGIWRNHTISLEEADMLLVLGFGAYATDFASVGQFGLRHQAMANQSGGSPLSSAAQSLFLDNITLVPEPRRALASFLCAATLLGLAKLRSHPA